MTTEPKEPAEDARRTYEPPQVIELGEVARAMTLCPGGPGDAEACGGGHGAGGGCGGGGSASPSG